MAKRCKPRRNYVPRKTSVLRRGLPAAAATKADFGEQIGGGRRSRKYARLIRIDRIPQRARQTGQDFKCGRLDRASGVKRCVKRKRLLDSHTSDHIAKFRLPICNYRFRSSRPAIDAINWQSAIENPSANGWPTPAALLNSGKQRRPGNPGLLINSAGTKSTGCCWPRFQTSQFLVELPFHPFPGRHSDPIGKPSSWKPGGGPTIRHCKDPSSLRRSSNLLAKSVTSTGSNTDLDMSQSLRS